jgi:hypothetical protein
MDLAPVLRRWPFSIHGTAGLVAARFSLRRAGGGVLASRSARNAVAAHTFMSDKKEVRMKLVAICGALTTMLMVSTGAVAQTSHDYSAEDPLTAIVGGIFGFAAPSPHVEAPLVPDNPRRSMVVAPQRSERFVMQPEANERGYMRTTVKGRAVLVDPRTRRIVQVLE